MIHVDLSILFLNSVKFFQMLFEPQGRAFFLESTTMQRRVVKTKQRRRIVGFPFSSSGAATVTAQNFVIFINLRIWG